MATASVYAPSQRTNIGNGRLLCGPVAGNFGWRWILLGAAAISVLGMAMVAVQVAITQGGQFGWLSPVTLSLFAASVIFASAFFRIEASNEQAFVDFGFFKNLASTGAVDSNLLLMATPGVMARCIVRCTPACSHTSIDKWIS